MKRYKCENKGKKEFQVSSTGWTGEKKQNSQGRIQEEDWPVISIEQQSHKLAEPGTHLEKNKLQLSRAPKTQGMTESHCPNAHRWIVQPEMQEENNALG